MPILKKQPRSLRAEDRAGVLELVATLTSGEDPRPWPDFERLSESEAVALVGLAERIRTGDVGQADRRFWSLVAVASGFAPDHFERLATERKAAHKAAAREAKDRRLNLGPAEEGGFFRAAAAALAAEDMWVDDLAALAVILAQFAAGRPFASTSHFTGTGREARLVVDWNLGGLVGPVDGKGALDNAKSRVAFLAEEGWIVLEGRGPQRSIALGPKLRAVLDTVPVRAPS